MTKAVHAVMSDEVVMGEEGLAVETLTKNLEVKTLLLMRCVELS